MRSSSDDDRLVHGGARWLAARVVMYLLVAAVLLALILSHLPAQPLGPALA